MADERDNEVYRLTVYYFIAGAHGGMFWATVFWLGVYWIWVR